jgi:hypothetical protein
VRSGVTFTLKGGMLTDKPVTLIYSSREVYTPASPRQADDFLSPYLLCTGSSRCWRTPLWTGWPPARIPSR